MFLIAIFCNNDIHLDYPAAWILTDEIQTESVYRIVYKIYKLPYNVIKKGLGVIIKVEMDYFAYCVGVILIISVLAGLSSGYAYLVNRRYSSDDPARKDYDPGAVFLAPITWLFIAFGGFIFTIIKALFFGIFLLFFSLAVALIRKPFFWPWIEPLVSRIGRSLLKANTFLIRLFFGDS